MWYYDCDKLFRIKRGWYARERRIPQPDLYFKPRKKIYVKLPEPEDKLGVPIFKVLLSRRSRRSYRDEPLTIEELSTLLFYALGKTKDDYGYGGPLPLRAFPTAGALNSIESYVAVNNVEGVERGIYVYDYMGHGLDGLALGDFRRKIFNACLEQDHAYHAAVDIALVARIDRTYWKYGERAYKYVHLDCGHAGQNLLLVAESLGFGACVIGAFYDEELCSLLNLDCKWSIPLEVISIGKI